MACASHAGGNCIDMLLDNGSDPNAQVRFFFLSLVNFNLSLF